VQSLFAQLERKALTQMHKEGLPSDRVVLLRSLDMRYAGQGYELEVRVPAGSIAPATLDQVESSFRDLYLQAYGYQPEDPVEVVTFRVVAVGNLPELELPAMSAAGGDASHAIKGIRQVYFEGAYQETRIYDGYRLQSGNRLQGPAVVEQRESTTVVLPGQQAVKGSHGQILITTAEISR
jgi:N-methylhydantoinase A